jgi:hypothetical protein
MNLQLNYLYRDAANYKQFGFVVFDNSTGLTPELANDLLLPKLISGEFFIPQDWGLPRLQFHPYDTELDHDYHEFESFEESIMNATDERDISVFLQRIKKGYE